VDAFEPATITAAILAGGEGTRIGGRDKGLELLAGEPLIAHVVAALAGQAGASLICANRNPERYSEFARVCADATAGFRGPLAGIAAALAACDTEWLLTLPVDCPRPPTDLARRLYAAVGSARAAVAQDGEQRQPLFALYRRELAGDAREALALDMPVWRWHDRLGAVEVDFSDARDGFVNLNTDDEFRRWEATRHG
jgi:molybdenum cofactor guanylyltransferase